MRFALPKVDFAKIGLAIRALVGSRFFNAMAGVSFTAFLAHVLFAPTRFPPVAFSSPLVWGLAPPPPSVTEIVHADERLLGGARQVVEATTPYVPDALQLAFIWLAKTFFGGDIGSATAFLNYVALGLWGVALVISLYLLAQQHETLGKKMV